MDNRLKLSTTKSLIFKPIEIEIDGKVYPIENLNTEKLLKMDDCEKNQDKTGEVEGLIHQLRSVIPELPIEIARKLDVRDIRETLLYIVDQTYSSPKIEGLKKKQPNLSDNKPVK